MAKLISWTAPTLRDDGSSLPSNEIFGYEIRQTVGDNMYFYTTATNSYNLPSISGDYGFVEVAVIDTQFVKSEYIAVNLTTTVVIDLSSFIANLNSPKFDGAFPTGNRDGSASVLSFTQAQITLPNTTSPDKLKVVEISDNGGSTWSVIAIDLPASTSRIINNLLPSTTYKFRYKMINIGGTASSYTEFGNITTPAATRTFHVAKSGSDTNNGLTLGTAFITVNKWHSVAAAGDICYVHAGTYIEDTVASTYVADQVYLDSIFCSQACLVTGTQSNPIVLRAWPADVGSVFFDNRGDTLSDSTARAGIYIAPNKNHWHFYGFKFINGWTTFIGSLGTGTGVGAGVTLANFSSNCVIENCSFKGLRGTPGVNCSAISPWMSNNWIIRNCYIDDLLLSAGNWGYGIQTYGQSNILIEHVTTTQNVAWGVYFKDHVASGYMGATKEGTISFNRLIGQRGGILVGINQVDSNAASTNYIQHNLIRASVANFAGIFVEMAGAGARSSPQYISQNTIDMQSVSAPSISLDSGDAYITSNISVRSGTDLQTVGYAENKASHGNMGARIKGMDYNVYESAFFAGLDDYTTPVYINGLSNWKAATTSSALSLAINNPDSHAVVGSLSALFNDTVDYVNKVGSPAIAINADGSNAGAYRFGAEILGTLPSYTAGV
jgi:hypothetical protein